MSCSPWGCRVGHDLVTEYQVLNTSEVTYLLISIVNQIFNSVQLLSHVRLCHSTDGSKPGFPVTNSRNLLRFMSIELVMSSNHLILCHPLLLLPSIFPASGSLQMSQLFASGGQSIGVSASTSVLPMNIQD